MLFRSSRYTQSSTSIAYHPGKEMTSTASYRRLHALCKEEYEVERILDLHIKKVRHGQRLKYLVHWKGYSAGERSWEPSANLSHARAKVNAFHRQNPSAPQAIHASVFLSIPWRPLKNVTEAPPPLRIWEEGRYEGIPSRTMGS